MKKFFAAFAIIFVSVGFSFAQHSVSYTITGLKNSRVYLMAVHGSRYNAVDSTNSVNGLIEFKDIDKLPVGVYRVSFADSLFTDIILNHEDVVMTNKLGNLNGGMNIISSEENKIFYEYWDMSTIINDSIRFITELGDAIYKSNNYKRTPDLDSMALKVYLLSEKLNKYTYQLISKSQGLFVNKLLKAYATPDWSMYKKTPGATIYKNKYTFLKEHFFDNVDFSDSTLLNSEVFYVLCTDYLTKYADPPTDSSYIAAIDFVLTKAMPYQPVYKYILNLFVNTFDDTEWVETFIHLVDEYLLKNTCTMDEHDKNMSERAAVLKKLKPGNKAPEINLNDINGKPVSLYDTKSKVTLLMFWSSECEHCEQVMPQILNTYSLYKPLGLEIFAVSADTDKNSWINAVKKNEMNWINVSDLKGFQSPAIIAYNAYSTPTFFILDSEKNILSHPYSPKEMAEGLQKALGK